jgi:hypothetical protein
MIFVEVQTNESESAVERVIADAYTATYEETPPVVHFGRVIVWKGRYFRELSFAPDSDPLLREDMIFRSLNMPLGKARILVGAFQGEVFNTPPAAGRELAARVKEGGQCGREYILRPFHYSSSEPEA